MLEARAIVESIEKSKKRVEEIGAIFKNYYSYTDTIFIPKNKEPNLKNEFLRLRIYKVNRWPIKNIVVTHKLLKWKGKAKEDIIKLKEEFDSVSDATKFIKDKFPDLKEGFVYFREGWEYDLNGKRIFIEDIRGFSPSVEVEGESESEIDELLNKIGIVERLSEPVPEIMRKILLEGEITKRHKPMISYCGIACSLCPSYITGECPGCLKLEGCKIAQCAKSKNIRFCFLCKDFPCKLFEEGFDWNLDEFPNLKEFKLGTVKWKPYSKEYIMLFKLKKENE